MPALISRICFRKCGYFSLKSIFIKNGIKISCNFYKFFHIFSLNFIKCNEFDFINHSLHQHAMSCYFKNKNFLNCSISIFSTVNYD